MTQLFNKFLIDERFCRIMIWLIDRAKHYSEIINLCYLLRGRKNIFCCGRIFHSHILAGLHVHVHIEECMHTLLLLLTKNNC